jgi:hypothetical protein
MQKQSMTKTGDYSPDTLLSLSQACREACGNLTTTLTGLKDVLPDEKSLLPQLGLEGTLIDLSESCTAVEELIPYLPAAQKFMLIRIVRLLRRLQKRLEQDVREIQSVASICCYIGDCSEEQARVAEILRDIMTESNGKLSELWCLITSTLSAADLVGSTPYPQQDGSSSAVQQSVRQEISEIRTTGLEPDPPVSARYNSSPQVAGTDIASATRDQLEDSGFYLPTTQNPDAPYIIEIKVAVLRGVLIIDLKREVLRLKRTLSTLNPEECGILRMRQYYYRKEDQCFDLVYDLPTWCPRPRTLRNALLDKTTATSYWVSDRVKLARRLANAVLKVHNVGMVHKNIRPDTILLCEDFGADNGDGHTRKLGTTYLVGFGNARNEGPWSPMIGEVSWEKDIYLHPQRQGLVPSQTYSLLHDIYSLGVVLLEVACWQSLVQSEFGDDGVRLTGEEMREDLVKKARKMVPVVIGDKFADVVLSCLNCLDDVRNSEHSDDADGDDPGVLSMETVVEALDQISL